VKPGKGLRRTGFTNRGKPLRRYTGLSRTPFRQPAGQSGKEGSVASSRTRAERAPSLKGGGRLRATHQPAVPKDVMDALRERSQGWCEIQLDGCYGRAVHPHHRITTKSGGRHGAAKIEHDRLSDLLHVDWYCHDEVTREPDWAKQELHGWSLNENDEPPMKPVLYRGDLVYLDDAGNKYSFEEAGA
jgi:hypothetical protein